jgi:PAS domain S-box-containing protein
MFRSRTRQSQDHEVQGLSERLSAVLRAVSDAVLEVDAQGVVTAANRRAAELVGLAPASLVGLPLRALTDGSLQAVHLLEEARRRRRWEGELTLRRADGTLVQVGARAESAGPWVVWSLTPPRAVDSRELASHVRQALHDLPLAAQAFDPDGHVIATNPAWVDLFGQTAVNPGERPNVLRGGSVFGPSHRSAVEQALRGQLVRLQAFPWPPPDARRAPAPSPKLLDLLLTPVRHPQGDLQFVLAIALDTTEQRRLEEELRESEARYRTLIEESPDGVFLVEDGLFRFVNRRFLQMFRTTSAECVDRLGPLAFCSPEDRPKLANYLRERLSTAAPTGSVSFVGVRLDGSRLECELQANRVVLRGKSMLLGTVRDLTEQKRVAEMLHFQASLLEQVQDAIVATDWEGRVVYWNRAAEALYGWLASDAVGRDFDTLVQPEARDTLARLRHHLLREGSWRGELQHRTADGRTAWLSATLSVQRDSQGRPVGVLGVYRDITEHKRLEEELLQAQKMESIGTLAGGIAHDFNNILGTIMGYLGLLKEELPSSPELQRYLDVLERSAQRASELTRQLLGFARKGKFEVRPLDLARLCAEVVELFRSTLDPRIQLHTHFPPDLPSVEGDASQLHQAVLNLCMNARDAMPEGGLLELVLQPVIAPDPSSGDPPVLRPYVCLTVRDTGVGMDEHVKARMFEPFFTTKGPGKGTGLGLAMVYGIVRNHGGFLEVDSEVGKGTVVRMYLPVASGAPEAEESGEGEVEPGAGETILVVDDEEPLCNLLRDVLTRRGYRVLVATDGQEALRLYREHAGGIDLVILDMTMPGLSGTATFDALRQLDPHARILLTSGYTEERAAREAVARGAKGFLQKPFLISELAARVREALQDP